MVKIDINLVIWNGKKYLPFCIESIFQQSFSDWQLNILDNGSTDGSVKYLKEHYPHLKVISLKENIGFAQGHNKLFSWTKSDYVLCLNQDVILDKDFLKNALTVLEKDSKIASLNPKIYHWDFKKIKFNDSIEPEKAKELLDLAKTKIIDTCGLKIFKNHQVVDWGQGIEDGLEFQKKKEIFGASGACPIYRKKALDEIKINNEYFDADFFSYKEDVDLAYRLQLASYSSYFIPQVIAYHDRSVKKSISVLKNRKLKSFWVNQYSYKNHFFCLIKNEFTRNVFKFFPYIFFYELKKIIYLIIFERQSLVFLWKNRKQFRKMLRKRKFIFKNIVKIKAKDLAKYFFSKDKNK